MSNFLSKKPMGVTEAAEFLGFSKTYLYKLIHLGLIACYKPQGGRVFFKQEDLQAFIFRGRRAADYELSEKADNCMVGAAELLNYI